MLVVWKLDRLGRSLHHLVRTVTMLSERGIGLKVLTGQGAQIDTTTAAGRLSFGIFAALAEFESELIRERTMAGLQAARARGRTGGRKFALTKAQVRVAQARHLSNAVSQRRIQVAKKMTAHLSVLFCPLRHQTPRRAKRQPPSRTAASKPAGISGRCEDLAGRHPTIADRRRCGQETIGRIMADYAKKT